MTTEDQGTRLKEMIEAGREHGFLVESSIREILPPEIVDEEQIQDLLTMISDMGIEVRKE